MPNLDQPKVHLPFEIQTKYGTYSDALNFPSIAAYAALSSDQIESLKQARVDAWVEVMENPLPPVEPDPEVIQADIEQLEEQKAALQEQLDQLITD